MQKLTKSIGTTKINKSDTAADVIFKRVLICRPNGRLGNMLLITPLLQEFTALYPECKIDLFVKGGIAREIFKNYPNVSHIIQLPKKPFNNLFKYAMPWLMLKQKKYDIVVNVINRSSSGRLSATLVNADYKFFGEPDMTVTCNCDDYENFAKKPVYNLRGFMEQSGLRARSQPVLPLDIKLDASEKENGRQLLASITKSDKPVMCIFTYATGDKRYPESWWQPFYNKINEAFGNEYIILEVLPVENVSQIGFKALSYYSKDIREIASVIANSAIFIGADSGMMHLAGSAQTPTVGLFRLTSPEIYQPYGNHSTGINTNDINTDGCIDIIRGVLNKSQKTG